MRMHAWAKPDGARLHVVVRDPLALLLNLNLPKRGVGYLELSQLDEGLRTAVAAGPTSKVKTSSAPTTCTESDTVIANKARKISERKRTGTPRASATSGSNELNSSGLNRSSIAASVRMLENAQRGS